MSVEEANRIQNEFFQKRLPSNLDSLQRVFRQRASKIHDSVRDYCMQNHNALSQCLPLIEELQKTVEAFNLQGELEDYVSKAESFFAIPEERKFEKFERTPEGQVPPSVVAQQKTLYNKLHSALRQSDKKAAASAEAEAKEEETTSSTSGILGKNVTQLMELQKEQYPRLKVPYVLVFLADSIIRQDGQHSDGIFRLSGSLPTMDKIKERLNVGDYVDPPDVHDASGLFKFILRSLPQPLVPTELYEAAINEPQTSHAVFSQIPEPNRTVAGFVVRFIHDYFLAPEIIEVTLMTPDNLATVLFPCLIRNPSSDLMEIMRHVEVEKAWMRKSFTSLDVSCFPSLDECREQAGLTGKAAPAAAPAASPAAPAATEAPAKAPQEQPELAKPTNPPPKPTTEAPKPAGSLPDKPTTNAPQAPPSALPTGAMNLTAAPGAAPLGGAAAPGSGLMLDFSSLNFSGSSMNLSSGGAGGDVDVTAILNGTQTSTMDFSSIPSFNFSTAPDLGSGMSAAPPMLPATLNLTLPTNVEQPPATTTNNGPAAPPSQ